MDSSLASLRLIARPERTWVRVWPTALLESTMVLPNRLGKRRHFAVAVIPAEGCWLPSNQCHRLGQQFADKTHIP